MVVECYLLELCLVVYRCIMMWGMVCLCVLLGIGEVSVLLSMRILSKFLIHRFLNRVTMVGSEVLTAMSTKMAVFRDVAPCRLVAVSHFTHRPDDGGSKDH
jgi:hypothetical protein